MSRRQCSFLGIVGVFVCRAVAAAPLTAVGAPPPAGECARLRKTVEVLRKQLAETTARVAKQDAVIVELRSRGAACQTDLAFSTTTIVGLRHERDVCAADRDACGAALATSEDTLDDATFALEACFEDAAVLEERIAGCSQDATACDRDLRGCDADLAVCVEDRGDCNGHLRLCRGALSACSGSLCPSEGVTCGRTFPPCPAGTVIVGTGACTAACVDPLTCVATCSYADPADVVADPALDAGTCCPDPVVTPCECAPGAPTVEQREHAQGCLAAVTCHCCAGDVAVPRCAPCIEGTPGLRPVEDADGCVTAYECTCTCPDGREPADFHCGAHGLTGRVENTTCRAEGTPEGLPALQLERAFPNVTFSSAVHLTHAPSDVGLPAGSDRLFVVSQSGRIRVFPNRDDVTQADVGVFLDISAGAPNVAHRRVASGGEEGLLSLAFHPDHAQNGFFYVYYSAHSPRRSVIARYRTVAGNPDQADPDSERIVLEVSQPEAFSNHKGGQLAFGRDGYLYVFLGDGGSGGDPNNQAQDLGSHLGKALRIAVNAGDTAPYYTVPDDNPFVGQAGALPEIWAWGLRNPWRCSFDRVTDDLWCGDVGQGQWEEIDVIVRGANYGWRRMEGLACYNPSTNCNDGTLTLPLHVYQHTGGNCSVTGGFVYRGAALAPDLFGAYVFGDYCTGNLWALRYDGTRVTETRLVATGATNVSSFGEDAAGELYVVLLGGTIQRLRRTAGATPGTFPATLSETGCFTDPAAAEPVPAPGVIPYDVNAPLWADGAEKRRFLALPAGGTLTYQPSGGWGLPEGTVLIKEFTAPGTGVKLETRLLVRRAGGFEGYSYQWNDAGTEAHLLQGSATRTYAGHTHYFPSRGECLACHTSAAGGTLGLQTAQMNRERDYDGVVDNQLRALAHVGLFGAAGLPAPPPALPRLVEPSDTTAPAEDRARSYVHGNCAQCHLPGGPTPVGLDLRYATTLAQTQTCGVTPQGGDLGVPGAAIVTPGSPDQSVLWLRMARRGAGQMPPLSTRVVDDAGAGLVAAWITSLAGCP
jgi:uncharacterized repeat protein (TIGR03806 family)